MRDLENLADRLRKSGQDAKWRQLSEILDQPPSIFYGRDVGYTVERLVLDEETERVSATDIRRDLAGFARTP